VMADVFMPAEITIAKPLTPYNLNKHVFRLYSPSPNADTFPHLTNYN
jgi:hypothetical protein